MGLLERISQARQPERSITTLEDYLAALQAYSLGYGGGVQQTWNGQPAERITNDLVGYATGAYASNGPVFALMAVRAAVFSSIRFTFQGFSGGRPSRMFRRPGGLGLLDRPWLGGTTQDLLMQMIVDRDLAGNAYIVQIDDELVRLRPDWVAIIMERRRFRGGTLGYRRIGYVYQEGGLGVGGEPVPLLPDEVCHFAGEPDPLAYYRGMSWLTPVIRELSNDKQMLTHQKAFLENAATPNMVVSLDASITAEQFKQFKETFKLTHQGAANAYKTLFLGGGADVTVVGADFAQLKFTETLGRGETRLASAAGVPVTIVGFSEGLQGSTLNQGNYGQARRRFADGTMHPLWQNAAGSLETIVPAPDDRARLWYDARDVPFLREDAKDSAEIISIKAQSIRALGDGGWQPDTVRDAVDAEDLSLIQHSGRLSVQLQPPGQDGPSPNASDDADDGTVQEDQ